MSDCQIGLLFITGGLLFWVWVILMVKAGRRRMARNRVSRNQSGAAWEQDYVWPEVFDNEESDL